MVIASPLTTDHAGEVSHIMLFELKPYGLAIAGSSPALSQNPFNRKLGWSGGAMVLGKLPLPGRPTILITVGQGPIALAVGAGGGSLDIFTLIYPFSSFSLSLGDGPI